MVASDDYSILGIPANAPRGVIEKALVIKFREVQAKANSHDSQVRERAKRDLHLLIEIHNRLLRQGSTSKQELPLSKEEISSKELPISNNGAPPRELPGRESFEISETDATQLSMKAQVPVRCCSSKSLFYLCLETDAASRWKLASIQVSKESSADGSQGSPTPINIKIESTNLAGLICPFCGNTALTQCGAPDCNGLACEDADALQDGINIQCAWCDREGKIEGTIEQLNANEIQGSASCSNDAGLELPPSHRSELPSGRRLDLPTSRGDDT